MGLCWFWKINNSDEKYEINVYGDVDNVFRY